MSDYRQEVWRARGGMTLQIWEASVLQAAFPPIEAARWPRAGAPIAAAPELAGIPIVFTAPPVAVRLASTALPAQPPLAVPAPLALRIAPRIYVVSAVSRPVSYTHLTLPT